MDKQQDPRIAELLQQAAPPARDPLFRVRVLERREQREFRHRLYIIVTGGLAILLISGLAIGTGGRALEMTGVPVASIALATTCLAFRKRLAQIVRQFRP